MVKGLPLVSNEAKAEPYVLFFTCKRLVGAVVPIPTLPVDVIFNLVAFCCVFVDVYSSRALSCNTVPTDIPLIPEPKWPCCVSALLVKCNPPVYSPSAEPFELITILLAVL